MVPLVLGAWGLIRVFGSGSPAESVDIPAQPPAVVAPSPVSPEPVSPEPVSPEPVSPEPVSPEPVKTLARSEPTHILIKSVWINAVVGSVGIHANGVVETPPYTIAGWYRLGPSPGEAGAAVILGHLDNDTKRAVFFELRRVKPGAIVEVTRADRSRVRFKVDSVEQFHKSAFPTGRVYGPSARPVLRLVTCGGRFDPATRQYSDNIIAFASLVG